MEYTLLSIFWFVSFASVLLCHTVIALWENKVPDVIKAAYKFGKLKIGKLESKTFIPVPKSWFVHFYAFGTVAHTLIVVALGLHLYQESSFSLRDKSIWTMLNWPQVNLKERNALPVVIVFIAEWIQMMRRLYECLFVSSFSKGTMSPIHYFYGCFLYTTFGLGLLASVDVKNLAFNFDSTKEDLIYYLPAALLFVWASIYQHKAMRTFASLRKKEDGKPAKGHFIPKGHLFQLVSCPHYLCEIVIYFSLCLVFKMSSTYLFSIFTFVVINQISSSLMSHHWYKHSFPNYPKSRKAVFPYLL